MAPTSRTGRRRWNPKRDADDQVEDDTANVRGLVRDFELNGELLRRTLSELLGRGKDEDEDQDGDGEDEDRHEDLHSDLGLPPPLSLPHLSLPQPPPIKLPPNPLSGLLPPPKTDPPTTDPPKTSPPAADPPKTNPPGANPPKTNPPAAAPPPQAPLPPSSSIPPQESATGITGNFASASPSADPRRTTLSAALPKSTGSGDDSDDGDDEGSTSSAPSPTRSTFSKSTRSILSLTPAIAPPYETQSTEKDGQTSITSSTKTTTRSLTTSTNLPVQTPETATRIDTSIPSPSGASGMGQGQETARTSRLSPGGEKAVIASATIVGLVILLVLAWFLWRRSSKRKAAGRKNTWPANFPPLPSREIFDGPRRVSSKVGEKFTSMKSHLRRPSALGWCSIGDDDDDNDAPKNEKSAAPVAANAGGLLERRLGTSTPPQRVTVNSYGVIFRKPKRDSILSDIFLPRGQQRTSAPFASERTRGRGAPSPSSPERSREMGPSVPPSPEGIRIPIMRPSGTQMAAAAHLENARKSVITGSHSTPRTPRTPLRRNNRVSDVSSLSSGFGDGDIVIIQPPTAAVAVKTADPSVIGTNVNVVAVRSSPERKSYGSRFSRNRDTYLTNSTSSDDSRPRFRSISSWVGQQSRRVKRVAASRNEDGVPNMPDNLPEQGFDMMMPDGQEPRRVESSMWRK